MARLDEGFRSIDEYIATFPAEVQARLEAVRAAIQAAAPEAVEAITYQMPAFVQDGTLVNFAAWKQHIGMYPSCPAVPEAFQVELALYATEKGALRFPHSQPLPLELIGQIVQCRVAANRANAAAKAPKQHV